MNDNIVLGVDIGGSHTTAALVNISEGTIVEGSAEREKIDPSAGAGLIIRSWSAVMNKSVRFAEIQER